MATVPQAADVQAPPQLPQVPPAAVPLGPPAAPAAPAAPQQDPLATSILRRLDAVEAENIALRTALMHAEARRVCVDVPPGGRVDPWHELG